jgi:hypothetical protein
MRSSMFAFHVGTLLSLLLALNGRQMILHDTANQVARDVDFLFFIEHELSVFTTALARLEKDSDGVLEAIASRVVVFLAGLALLLTGAFI